MRYLLDTHVLIWMLFNDEKLSKSVKEILQNPKNKIYVSAISFWEISIKFSISKLKINDLMPEDIFQECKNLGFEIIDLEAQLSCTYHNLTNKYHKDPFDRMLIWLAIAEKYSLITKDKNIKKYNKEGLKTIW